MRRIVLGTLLSALVVVRVAFAGQISNPTADSPSAIRLFANLVGHWPCSGAFADGRPLASDIIINPRADGRAVQYQHHDRAPNDFVQEALWGPDP
jgi:hypothetical protein